MALLDDFSDLEQRKRRVGGTECGVSRLLRTLPAAEAAALAKLIDETDVFATEIADALCKNGHQITSGQVSHHRRRVNAGGCTCPPPEAG